MIQTSYACPSNHDVENEAATQGGKPIYQVASNAMQCNAKLCQEVSSLIDWPQAVKGSKKSFNRPNKSQKGVSFLVATR